MRYFDTPKGAAGTAKHPTEKHYRTRAERESDTAKRQIAVQQIREWLYKFSAGVLAGIVLLSPLLLEVAGCTRN